MPEPPESGFREMSDDRLMMPELSESVFLEFRDDRLMMEFA